jgi:hypothetical protein
MDQEWIWVFNGVYSNFPSGVFTTRELAEQWIAKHGLEGTLTQYPVDAGVYDWALEHGRFRPKAPKQTTSEFISQFSSFGQEHYHYYAGRQSPPDQSAEQQT